MEGEMGGYDMTVIEQIMKKRPMVGEVQRASTSIGARGFRRAFEK